jgi:hypothetical protein
MSDKVIVAWMLVVDAALVGVVLYSAIQFLVAWVR